MSPANRWFVHHTDIEQILSHFDEIKFDGVFCDPPYGLGFMGRAWDSTVPSTQVWTKLLNVCKPGANLLAFASPRTSHRLITAIEDAGWIIRDKLYWLYGTGFPKSFNFRRKLINDLRWSGYGTGLKPAAEEIVLAMKPIVGSFVENAKEYGVAGLNIDGCRVGTSGGTMSKSCFPYQGNKWSIKSRQRDSVDLPGKGRWPANVLVDHDVARMLDLENSHPPSRFFFVPKASKQERQNNHHPTVKPLALCEQLKWTPFFGPRAGLR